MENIETGKIHTYIATPPDPHHKSKGRLKTIEIVRKYIQYIHIYGGYGGYAGCSKHGIVYPTPIRAHVPEDSRITTRGYHQKLCKYFQT